MNHQSPDWLRKKYWDEGLLLREMAALESVGITTIHNWMKKFGIRRRNRSERFRGERSPTWKGGRIARGGYIMIWQSNHPHPSTGPYVYEHRLVVERALGRYLKPSEQVHHINGIKDDNRLENLQLINHHRQTICPRCGWPMGNIEEYVRHKKEYGRAEEE